MSLHTINYNKMVSALAESEERFRQMADLTGEWLWEQNPQGYYIYSSAAVRQILGCTPEDVVGKHYTALLTSQDQANQQAYATSQQPFHSMVLHYRHDDGHLVYTESSGLPIFDTTGQLLKWRGVDRDITARKYYQDALIESEQRTRLVIENALSAIVLMDNNGHITDWNPCAEKMFGWAKHEAIGRKLSDFVRPKPICKSGEPCSEIPTNTKIGFIVNHLTEQTAFRRDGKAFAVELSISPLKVGGHYIYSGFINDISTRKSAEQQIRQAQIDLAINQSEIKIAQKIQTMLLPSAPLLNESLQIAGMCVPADKVGGDYFDYFFRDKNHLDMVIADVSGHAIGPALFMVEARSAIRTQTNHYRTPAQTLTTLNHFLYDDLNKAEFFITLSYLQYDCLNRQLRYANAGHPPPLLLRAGQKQCIPLDAEGLILGVRPTVEFEEKTITINTGDLVFIYTDGITETENSHGDFFGKNSLCKLLTEHAHQSPLQIMDAVLACLKNFCQKDSFNDDITMMVFKSL